MLTREEALYKMVDMTPRQMQIAEMVGERKGISRVEAVRRYNQWIIRKAGNRRFKK